MSNKNTIEKIFIDAGDSVIPSYSLFTQTMDRLSVTQINTIRNTVRSRASIPSSYYQSFFVSARRYMFVGIPVVIILLTLGITTVHKKPTHMAMQELPSVSKNAKTVSADSSIDEIADSFVADAIAEVETANTFTSSYAESAINEYAALADISINDYETII